MAKTSAKKARKKKLTRKPAKARKASVRAKTSKARAAKPSTTPRPPRASSKAELVVRQGFVIDATGGAQHAVPEVLILANREGLNYLSEVFAHLAEQAGRCSRAAEPAEPVHLSGRAHPVNLRLSDALEFRFAPLTAANRAASFKRYGVTMKSREKGSLFERYQQVADTQYAKVARQIQK